MIPALCSLRATLRVVIPAALLVSFGCTDSATVPLMPSAPQFAKGGGGGGTSVSAATPSYGEQGATAEQVTITGSGFAGGDELVWERGGAPSTKITVRETRFVSSTQLVATIDIAADAELAFYDIAVYSSGRKKGIGTEMFEVTTATSIGSLGGNTVANGGNDQGQVVGYTIVSNTQRAFYWSAETGMLPIGGMDAFGIDQAGTTIVGVGGGYPLVWTGGGANWTSTILPLEPTAIGGKAGALASDPLTGVASIIGGYETFTAKRGQSYRPRLWTNTGAGWVKVDLQTGYDTQTGTTAWVTSVSAGGQASGIVRPGGSGARAAAWEMGGQFKDLGDGVANGINSAATIVVGSNASGAVYYTRNSAGDAWSVPTVLPGDCGAAVAVDDSGKIVAHGCPIPGSSRVTSAVFYPPSYTSYALLGGLGDRTEGGKAFGISRGGTLVFGTAPTKPTRVAVIWQSGF